jgi:hypothetical protein
MKLLSQTILERGEWHSDIWWKGCMGQKRLRTTGLEHEADNSCQFSDELNAWSFTSTPLPIVFIRRVNSAFNVTHKMRHRNSLWHLINIELNSAGEPLDWSFSYPARIKLLCVDGLRTLIAIADFLMKFYELCNVFLKAASKTKYKEHNLSSNTLYLFSTDYPLRAGAGIAQSV